MAKEIPGFVYTAPAAADLSSSQYLFGKINSSGNVAVVATAGVDHDGVIQNDVDAAGKAVQLIKNGITKAVAGTGGAVRGSRCSISSTGKAVQATGDSSVGMFLDTVSANEVCSVLLDDAPSRRGRTKRSMNVETLAATKTLAVTDKFYQKLDPGGSARNVVLPTESSSVDLDFQIINAADAAENLVVKASDGSTTIATINQNEEGIFVCDGTTWVLARVATIALS